MKLKVHASLATLVALLSLTAACTKSQTDAPQAVQASDEATSDSNQPTETVPAPPAVDPQIQECELDAVTSDKIAALETQLATLRTKFTDLYPDVVALKETIQRTKEYGLSQCLEKDRSWDCELVAVAEARWEALRRQLEGESSSSGITSAGPIPNAIPGITSAGPIPNASPDHSTEDPVYRNLKIQYREAEVYLATAKLRCFTSAAAATPAK